MSFLSRKCMIAIYNFNSIGRRVLFPDNKINVPLRLISASATCNTRPWRRENNKPINRTSAGPLTNDPDFTYLDGRPSPVMGNQQRRLKKHREFAEQIVKLSSEIDFAVDREKKMNAAKDEERDNIIRNRLKAKGKLLKKEF